MSPLLILLIGMVTVVALIIVVRLHAFFALLTAALVVSLLVPGRRQGCARREGFRSDAGTLVNAQNLGIDLGTMIIVGLLVALPAATAGMLATVVMAIALSLA